MVEVDAKYLDERFARLLDRINALERLLTQRQDAANAALVVAKTSLNEMRGMAIDYQLAFLTKAEYSSKHEMLVGKIESVEKSVLEMRTFNRGAVWAAAGIASVASALISWAVSIYFFISSHGTQP